MSPLAAELARLVALSRAKRVLVEELFKDASRFDPVLVGGPEAQSRFRDALDELQAAPLCQDQVRHQGQQLLVELEG